MSLIDRVRVDDSQAWRELVDLYGPLVAYWCRRAGVPERSVGDCVQNVFLGVLRSLPNFNPSQHRHGFRGWLWGLTRHKCVDMLRSDARQPDPVGGSDAYQQTQMWQDQAAWSEVTETHEIARLMRRALGQVEHEFEQKTWQAFWRTTVDGIATNIVAEELALETATVRQYRSRVLRRLRKQLGDLP